MNSDLNTLTLCVRCARYKPQHHFNSREHHPKGQTMVERVREYIGEFDAHGLSSSSLAGTLGIPDTSLKVLLANLGRYLTDSELRKLEGLS